ncbi:unnamed protein product [Paramecium sonneborni]|uniref:PX domain-containing protein n=1 Tax=Paramecium sonneborni TaxID=65129 RepID=A0A8S1NSX9_9CILI|nr:unnamed protein product [Paramecium sonneborni]
MNILSYDIKILGVETYSDNILYKLRIINTRTLGHRDIRVKFNQLSDLHSILNDINPEYNFPPFPKKEFFQSLFGENKFIKQKEQMISEYFAALIKSPPPCIKPLLEFLNDGSDFIRQKELQKEISTKKELFKLIKPQKILKKSLFGKTTLCTLQGKKVILHKFYVLKSSSDELLSHYFNMHLQFTDFTYVCQVIHIFFLHAKLNLMDSMLLQTKQPRSCKKQHFEQAFQLKNKYDVVKLFSIEVYEGQNLEEIIQEKRTKKIPFTQNEILHLIQNLLRALLYLNNNNCYPNRVTTTSIIINEENVKLTGILEPNEKYKDIYIIEGYALRTDQQYDVIYFPPERLNSYQINQQLNLSWQFGVCILKAALLYTNKELEDIHDQSIIQQLIQKVKNKYGQEMKQPIFQCLV